MRLVCSALDCDRTRWARSLCSKHYRAALRAEARRIPPTATPRSRATVAAATAMQQALRDEIRAHRLTDPDADLSIAEALAADSAFWLDLADVGLRSAAPLLGKAVA